MNLIIDEGNTKIKFYFVKGNNFVKKSETFQKEKKILLLKEKEILQKVKNVVYSSVLNDTEEIENFFKNKFLVKLTEKTPVPIKNFYKTPETLGKDRLAAVVGASVLFPGKNVLVIDAGTAITYDFINSRKEYYGGNISPGLRMRFRALHEFTAALPIVEPEEQIPFTGSSTKEAILAGVVNGIVFEIEGYINRFKSLYKDLKVILTGGDIFYFEKRIKNHIFAEPNLVPIGLNEILNYNLKTKK